MKKLLNFYRPDGPERIGFVVDGDAIEVRNVSPSPLNSCVISAEDLIRYGECASASWHTHPGGESNLSADDYVAFLNWPKLKHFIVGKDGVRCFSVEDGAILET